jgi:dienelactone hydrolase
VKTLSATTRTRQSGAVGRRVLLDGMSAYFADGDGPGVVVLHEWWALVPQIEDVCERLAAKGFTALAPDLRLSWERTIQFFGEHLA